MSDPLEELMRQNAELFDRFAAENEEMDRAFQSGTLDHFLTRNTSDGSDGSDDGSEGELAGEASS